MTSTPSKSTDPKVSTNGLRKQFRLFDVYAVATGATLSAGFFLLPGIAAETAGAGIILSYLIAALPLLPATFSILELATAMPRAGGVYYFLDRSMSPLVGTIGGIGTWLSLVLKVSFALVGMGAYLGLFFDEIPMTLIAIGLALALGVLNLVSAKKTTGLQAMLAIGLLVLLAFFVGGGATVVEFERYQPMLDQGWEAIFSTAGLVYISYVGVTKVASLSEEIENPTRNLPLGVLLSFATAVLVYGLGTAIMVGVLPMHELVGNLTPVAAAAEKEFGYWGKIAISVAALMAFTSVANAGTLSASRYPLAMSRDYMLPLFMRKVTDGGIPYNSVIITTAVIVGIIALLDPTRIAKLASAFQLLMFAMVCLAVIVMRESRIESYDPGYHSPLYPWMQIFGIVAPLYLISKMGDLPILFSLGLVAVGIGWYYFYARRRAVRAGAIYHLYERLGQRRDEGLDRELRGILKEKGLRKDDPFDVIVSHAFVLDYPHHVNFGEIVKTASAKLHHRCELTTLDIEKRFFEGTRIGRTPVAQGVALPHFKLEGLEHPELVIVRCQPGVNIEVNPDDEDSAESERAYALFFLISPAENPAQHLRIMAQIASHVEEERFGDLWLAAKDDDQLREAVLRDEGFLSLDIYHSHKSGELIGKRVRDMHLPEGALVTVIRRNNVTSVPGGSTILHDGDRLTIIGEPEILEQIEKQYGKFGGED